MKNVIKISIVLILITSLMSCHNHDEKQSGTLLLKCEISASLYQTYLIQIFKNGDLNVVYGEKSIESDSIVKVINQKSCKLNENDMRCIKELHSQVIKINSIEKVEIRKGGWEIVLIIDDKRYHFYYGEYENTPLGLLIKSIIRKSPILLDLHSWS